MYTHISIICASRIIHTKPSHPIPIQSLLRRVPIQHRCQGAVLSLGNLSQSSTVSDTLALVAWLLTLHPCLATSIMVMGSGRAPAFNRRTTSMSLRSLDNIQSYHVADIFFFFTNFDVRIQNNGAVATWTKSWWRCRICNKNHRLSFTFPILFCNENTKVSTIAMSFPQKSRSPK